MPYQLEIHALWKIFQDKFITPDGRVVDTGNNDISHSEGQAWAMFFAAHVGDKAAFDKVRDWTLGNLCVRDDALMAWRWSADIEQRVDDFNNASDGDIFHTWALIKAADRWNSQFVEDARKIADDLKRNCMVEWNGRTVLLPGTTGFVRDADIVCNPSYYIYPAFTAIAEAFDDPAWLRLVETGLLLDQKGRFGDWALPADWLSLLPDGSVKLAEGFAPRYGYEAIRVPIYLKWGKLGTESRLKSFVKFSTGRNQLGHKPDWVNLIDNSLSDYNRPVGVDFVYQALRHGGESLNSIKIDEKLFDTYYDGCLILLSALALQASAT